MVELTKEDLTFAKLTSELHLQLKDISGISRQETFQYIEQVQDLLASSINQLQTAINSIHQDAAEKLRTLMRFLEEVMTNSANTQTVSHSALIELLTQSNHFLTQQVDEAKLDPGSKLVIKHITEKIQAILPGLESVRETVSTITSSAKSIFDHGEAVDSVALHKSLMQAIHNSSQKLNDIKQSVIRQLDEISHETRFVCNIINTEILTKELEQMIKGIDHFIAGMDMNIDSVLLLDKRMSDNIDITIQAMQVGDIAHQLLDKIKESSEMTSDLLDNIPPFQEDALGYARAIGDYNGFLANLIGTHVQQDTILQEKMDDEGDVELF